MPGTVRINDIERFRSRSTRARLVVAAALGCLVLAGCAGEAPSPPSSPPSSLPVSSAAPTSATYSAQLCSAAADFQSAANDIVALDATAVGVDGVRNALQNLATAASTLRTAAQAQFGPQGAELERAVASLRGTIAGLTSQDSLSSNLGRIAASVAGVEQAAKPIVDSVRTGCPSVPPAEAPPAS